MKPLHHWRKNQSDPLNLYQFANFHVGLHTLQFPGALVGCSHFSDARRGQTPNLGTLTILVGRLSHYGPRKKAT